VDINLKQDMAYDLVEELHDQGIRVIAVTGYPEWPVTVDNTIGFVQKPFRERELIAAMSAALGRRH